MVMPGTRVTATDVDTDESESKIIENDYVLICDGRVYLDHVQNHGNGTTILTIKTRVW